MFQIIKRNPTAAVIAVLMHVAIILFMIVGVDWLKKPEQPKSNVQVVKARVVDQAQLTAEMEALKKADNDRKQAQDAARRKREQELQELQQRQKKEESRLAELEKQRKAEEQKRLEADKRRKLEAAAAERKKVEEKERKAAAESKRKQEEAKRLAEAEKRKQAEAAKRKAEAEAKRKQEARRLAEEKKRKEDEARRVAEENKRKAAEAARRAREAELQAAAEAERDAREIDRYTTLIKQKIVRNWLRPAGISDDLKCRLRVRLASGGVVIGVSVVSSSGSGAFDRAATAAVYKAEPLPVPDGGLFERFRDINFEFNPSG